MQVDFIWIVTRPTALSTEADICFCTDAAGLRRQFLGGLNPEDIVAMFTRETEALKLARLLLAKRGLSAEEFIVRYNQLVFKA